MLHGRNRSISIFTRCTSISSQSECMRLWPPWRWWPRARAHGDKAIGEEGSLHRFLLKLWRSPWPQLWTGRRLAIIFSWGIQSFHVFRLFSTYEAPCIWSCQWSISCIIQIWRNKNERNALLPWWRWIGSDCETLRPKRCQSMSVAEFCISTMLHGSCEDKLSATEPCESSKQLCRVWDVTLPSLRPQQKNGFWSHSSPITPEPGNREASLKLLSKQINGHGKENRSNWENSLKDCQCAPLNTMTRHHTCKMQTTIPAETTTSQGYLQRYLSRRWKSQRSTSGPMYIEIWHQPDQYGGWNPMGRPPIIIKSQTSERHGEAGIDMMDKEYPNNFRWSVDKTI